jgi:hypothetical protein
VLSTSRGSASWLRLSRALSRIITNRKRRKTITHVEQAELLVAEGERNIARQREIVTVIKRRRGPRNAEALRMALELMQTLELAQQPCIAHRDRLQAAVAEGADTSL